MFNLSKTAILSIGAALLLAAGLVYYIYKGPQISVTLPEIIRPTVNNTETSQSPTIDSVSVDYTGISKMFSPYEKARLPHRERIVYICSGYGCIHSTRFFFTAEQINEYRYNFRDVKDAEHERRVIALTIAQIEKKVAEKIGEDNSGESWRDNSKKSQMGVSDEAINATSYLIIMARNGLLKYHNVKAPVWKGNSMFAVIEELGTKDIYSINSAIHKNGEVPIINKL